MTWRNGVKALFVVLAVAVLLSFLYTQSQHDHQENSYYNHHAGFAKPAAVSFDSGQFLTLLPVAVAVPGRTAPFATIFSVPVSVAAHSGPGRDLNCRAPPHLAAPHDRNS